MARFITFGELLLRLKAPGHERLFQSARLEAVFGGAEANVAVSLACFGLPTEFVSAVPGNDVGAAAIAELRRFGVGTRNVIERGTRLGLYYLEAGADQRAAKVVYDREDSALATAPRDAFDWQAILTGAAWLHVTGITPALSQSAADLTLDACRAARELGVRVSCDFNYRSKLWRYGKTAAEVMRELVRYVDIAIASRGDCEHALGIAVPSGASGAGIPRAPSAPSGSQDFRAGLSAQAADRDTYAALTETVLERYANLRAIAITLREAQSADRQAWSACLRDASGFHVSRRYELASMVDPIGAGDAFAAGLIYGMTAYRDAARALDFAAAAGCLKHTVPGDFNRVTLAEVEAVVAGANAGRVQR